MTPKWMEIARKEIGQHEIAGKEANPRIVEYHASTGLKATSDEVAWCSSFVNWVMTKCGMPTTGSAAAISWARWGFPCHPLLGAVTVIRKKQAGADRATGSTSGNHVGFLVSIAPDHVRLLGGNQGDQVKESSFPLASYEIVACRWPIDNPQEPVE